MLSYDEQYKLHCFFIEGMQEMYSGDEPIKLPRLKIYRNSYKKGWWW